MTATFDNTVLPNASKLSHAYPVPSKDLLLLSGKHLIQSASLTGFEPKYRCLGTWTQFEAVLAKVGTFGTLVTDAYPSGYTDCCISSITVDESENPGYFYFDVSFKRDTS
jgi:hypothetical protein